MGLCVPCAHMSECIPYRDMMRNSVKMSKKDIKAKKVSYGSGSEKKAAITVGFSMCERGTIFHSM
jgi:hypothetical protein